MTKQHVLILEDDHSWQTILSELVADLDYEPFVVSSYHEAVAALSQRSYVLALVDISLSLADHADRGGVEALKAINQLSAKLPTVVVTGHATVDLAVETMAELDAAYLFRKDDFDRRTFKRVIKEKVLPEVALHSLSDREREVLSLLREGHTNREIAKTLTISVNTVKKHVQSIFTKLGVNTRSAAVAKAAEQET